MSKWTRLPLVSKQITNSNRHHHLAKTSVTKSVMYHEQQRFENSEDEHLVFAFELHKKFCTITSWEERKPWAMLFGRGHGPDEPILISKMKIKVEFNTASQVDEFFKMLQETGIPTDKVKAKRNHMVLDIESNLYHILLKTLNSMSPFKDKMRRDIINWLFHDANCAEAKNFNDEVFGQVAMMQSEAQAATKTESQADSEVPAPVVSIAVDTISESQANKEVKSENEPEVVATPESVSPLEMHVDDLNNIGSEPDKLEPLTEHNGVNRMESNSAVENEKANSLPEVLPEVTPVQVPESSNPEITQVEKQVSPPGSPRLFSMKKAAEPTDVSTEAELELSNSPRP